MAPRMAPKRSYRAVVEALRQVWTIERVPDVEAVWALGEAERVDGFDPHRIRVGVWNLYKGAGGMLFEHDFRSLCYRSDLVMTQEALLSRRSMRTFCERGFEAVHAASYKRRDGLRDGVMTASRVPSAVDLRRRIVCKYPEPLLKTPKAALVETFPIAGSSARLMVINIHATLIRRVSAAIEEMEHLLENLPPHQGPLLLAGDFNTFTATYLRAAAAVLAKIGLAHVVIPDDPRPRSQALDQVFCRGLRVVSAVVDTSIKSSDHFPLVAEFAVDLPKTIADRGA